MLGLFLLYFIGKAFYTLAKEFDKSKWGYAVLGIISYYAGTFIAGFTIILLIELGLISDLTLDDVSDTGLSVVAFPFGLLASWGLHKILRRQWSSHSKQEAVQALDSDMLQ